MDNTTGSLSIDDFYTKARKLSVFGLLMFLVISVGGCSDSPEEKVTWEDKLLAGYVDNNRLDKYYDLKERYGDNRIVLWLNTEEDSWWITNFTLWAMFSILPDLPDVLAGGGVLAIINGVAWFIGVTLAGGGILAVLAYVGAMFGGVPGIAPAVMGIIYIGVMFSILQKIFGLF